MRPIYWFIRHKIARNTADNIVLTIDEMSPIHTPWLLRLFNLELMEVNCTNPNNNPFTFVGVIWLIKKRNQTFDKNQIYTWRIQGKDKNKSTPMVLWADSI